MYGSVQFRSAVDYIIPGYAGSRNLDAEGDGFHDKDSVWEDSSHLLHAGEILDRIPHISVFIQQLEPSYREGGRKKKGRWRGGRVSEGCSFFQIFFAVSTLITWH